MSDRYTLTREVVVNASPERAFEVFTARFDTWWPREHHIGKAELKEAILEPRPGGRWYEICVDGSTCEWGKVLEWEPPARLVLAWQLTNEWKFDPDFLTEVEVTFESLRDGTTRVRLQHKNLDRYGENWEKLKASLDSDDGWGVILQRFAAKAAE